MGGTSTDTATPPLPPRVEHVLKLAEIIREVHGSTITVDALALAILAHPGFSGCHDGPAAPPAQEPGEVEELGAFLDGLAALPIFDRDCVAQIRRVAKVLKGTRALPPGYIDREHQGEDRKLLEAFYLGWQPGGGTTDEKVLRSIRAVLALRPSVADVRAADATISDEALEAEFRAWWKAKVHHLNAPRIHAVTTHLAWGRHLLSRGQP